VQRHLSCYFGQRLHQKMRRPHPHLQRAERMLDRLATSTHRIRITVQARLRSINNILVLPPLDATLRSLRALSLQRAGAARVGPLVTSLPPLTHPPVRSDSTAGPSVTPPPTPISNDPASVVRAFYLALARADGDAAQLFVVPEKRGIGPFNPVNIKQFYSRLPKPIEILSVELVSNDMVEVKYHFDRPNGSECRTDARIHTTIRAGQTLIRSITANC
jgi:hypothetical protein